MGHVLAQEPWEVVCFPAIAEEDEAQIVETVWGAKTLTRHQGEALHPAREPLPMLEHLRQMIGEYNFAGQYQQAPTPLGGGMVKRGWFRHYTASELPRDFDRMPQRDQGTASYCIRLLLKWGVRLFIKMDPPRGKIALSTFRWTRAGALIAVIALIPALYNWLSLPRAVTAGQGNSAKAQPHTARPMSVDVIGVVPSTTQPSEPKTINDVAGTSAIKQSPRTSGGLLTLGVGN